MDILHIYLLRLILDYVNSANIVLLCDCVYSYETSDGVSRSEVAELKNAGTENEALSVRGTITWVDADGQSYTLNFLADENGFQPEGAHLPKV